MEEKQKTEETSLENKVILSLEEYSDLKEEILLLKKNKEKKPKTLKQKILELKKKIAIMQKNASGYGYKYVTEDSILLNINDDMIEMGIKLTPQLVPGTLHSEIVNYTDTKGKAKTDVLVTSEMLFIWEDIETGEKEIIPWALTGQQGDGSQAFGSGLTYANRYFLLKYFNVATSEEDPDAIRSKMEAEEERKKLSAIQTKIKNTFNKLISKYQTQAKVYEVLGTTKEQFTKDYNNKEKNPALLEQMELLLKEDSDVESK